MGAAVAVGSEIDHEGIGVGEVDLVGAEQHQHLQRALADHLLGGQAAAPGDEAEVQAADPRGSGVQHVESVEAVAD